MVIKKMLKFYKTILIILFLTMSNNLLAAEDLKFQSWLIDFSEEAKKKGVSEETINNVLKKSIFLEKVIEYDRYQPEFYEDTYTYVSKRSSKSKVKKGKKLYFSQKNIIDEIEKNYFVDKSLLLALMGIETNFGSYMGKMDIISSLATLSFDKRRSLFFQKELLTLLKLIDVKTVSPNILYGSWAGAFGNFQFMPSTIKNYAIDYDKNSFIELKKTEDSFASAANYLNKIGWNNEAPCFYKVKLKNNIPKKYLNTSAKKITGKKELKYFKKYIVGNNLNDLDQNLIVAIITPDKDIVSNAENLSPAYLVFNNYEIILKWNRSLRFALAVCTLKDLFINEI